MLCLKKCFEILSRYKRYMNRNFPVSLSIELFCSFFVALKLVKCLFTQTLLDYKLCYDRHTECLSFILNKRTVLIILVTYITIIGKVHEPIATQISHKRCHFGIFFFEIYPLLQIGSSKLLCLPHNYGEYTHKKLMIQFEEADILKKKKRKKERKVRFCMQHPLLFVN